MSVFELFLGSETLRRIRAKVEGAISPYNTSPPPQGILVLGFDGSLTRMLRTDSDGRLQVGVVSVPVTKGDWLSTIPNPPNLDVALSTRASEATLVAIRDRLPASLTSAGNLRIAILEDTVGIAKDATLSSILSRLDINLSTRASETTLTAIRDRLDIALSTRASEATLAAVRDRLPPSLTAAGNFKIAILEDTIGLAKDSTLTAIRDRLPSSLTTVGNFRVAILEDAVGLAKSSDLVNLSRLDVPLSTLSRLVRWGRDVSPFWVHGSEVTAPAAGTALVSRTVSTGRTGYVYGFCISAGEPNHFRINWTSGGTSRSVRVVFPGGGSLCYVDIVPVNEGLPADSGTTITITNVNSGSAGVIYQARILYAEV